MKWKSNLNIVLICEKPKKSSKSKENKNTKTSKRKTPKGTCFHCGVDGHWKRNCPKYLADLKEKKKGKFDLLVLEACLVEDNSSSWIVDSGTTNHVCFSLPILSSTRKLADGEVTMRVGSGQIVSAAAVGTARLEFENNKFLVLENVYYIPGFSRNLISVSMLHEQGFKISFNNNSIVISRYGFKICYAKSIDGLYKLQAKDKSAYNSELFKTTNPRSI